NARRGRSRRRALLTSWSGPVTASATFRFQPCGWMEADLWRPGAFRTTPRRRPASATITAAPADWRRRPPSAIRGSGRRRGGVWASLISKAEVDEWGDTFGPHRIGDEERESEDDRLRGDGQAG